LGCPVSAEVELEQQQYVVVAPFHLDLVLNSRKAGRAGPSPLVVVMIMMMEVLFLLMMMVMMIQCHNQQGVPAS